MNDKNETWTVFGDRLKSELERQGLTLTQISKKTGMPLPTLSRYAKSQRIPLATHILRVAEALGVTCDYMLGLSDDPHKTRLGTELPLPYKEGQQMDDPTKDTIPRSAVEYCLRKETVSTNPEAYKAHKKFIGYMDDPEISQFGHWMHSNGFNCALVSIAVDLDKIPSAQRWIPCSERLPMSRDWYLGIFKEPDTGWINPIPYVCDYVSAITSATTYEGWILHHCTDQDMPCEYYKELQCVAWMPLPEPWKGGQ